MRLRTPGRGSALQRDDGDEERGPLAPRCACPEESWLKGEVDDGSTLLTGKDGAVLNGTVEEGERIRGTADIDGGHHALNADRTKPPSGLYRATVRGAEVDGGRIVLPDGRQVGVLTRAGEPSPAPRIPPETGAVTIDGQQLTARPGAARHVVPALVVGAVKSWLATAAVFPALVQPVSVPVAVHCR